MTDGFSRAQARSTLRRMSLRRKVAIEDASEEYDVCVSTSNAAHPSLSVDPRMRDGSLGYRGALPANSAPFARDVSAAHASTRIALGVAEGAKELAGAFPLECNLDAFDAVSFSKGCYVGQENTARQRFRGAVRKRVAPLTLATAFDGLVPGAAVVNARGDAVGEVIASADARFALFRARVKFLRDVAAGAEGSSLRVGDVDAAFVAPRWWPASYMASDD